MGQVADALVNGDDCQVCGEYIGEGDGFPQTCSGCGGDVQVGEWSNDKFDEVMYNLQEKGYRALWRSDYHISITQPGRKKRLDLFPKNQKYHDVQGNKRGTFNMNDLEDRVENFFKTDENEL